MASLAACISPSCRYNSVLHGGAKPPIRRTKAKRFQSSHRIHSRADRRLTCQRGSIRPRDFRTIPWLAWNSRRGLEVEPTEIIGIYSRPLSHAHVILFRAKAVGGSLIQTK